MFHLAARLRAVFESLTFRLTFGAVAALAVGMGVVAFLLLRQTESDTLEAARQRHLNETVRVAQVLSRRVVELQRALQVTAAQLDAPTQADPQRLAEFIRRQPVLSAMFSSIFVSAQDGTMLLLSQHEVQSWPGIALGDREYIRQTLSAGRPVVSKPIVSRVSGDALIVFTYPLRHEGRVTGALAAALNLTSRDLLADQVDGDDGGPLVVVADTAGTVLAHPQLDQVLQPVTGQPRLAEAFAAWRDAGMAAEPSGLSLPQPGEIVSASGVAGTDWVVWRALPESDVLAPLSAARHQAGKLVGGLLAAMSLVMIALLTVVLRPLLLLETRAQHLFDGQLAPDAGWPRASGELRQLTSVLRHVGIERAELERRNEQVLKRLESVMSSAPIGIAFTRGQRFELVGAELCRLLGRSESELLHQPVESIYVDQAHYLGTLAAMEPAFRRGEPYIGEWQMQRADGSAFCAQLRGRLVDPSRAGAGTIWTVSDVTEQVASRALLEWSAGHDVLTGLANRKLLEPRLATLFEHRDSVMPAALVVIDLDHFKPINDNAGHAAGDAMLKAVAQAISARVRAGDMVARTGGDEFVLLLDRCPADTAARIVDEVREAIAAIVLPWNGKVFRVGASLGVAMLRRDSESPQSWLEEADLACYEAKRAGRGGAHSGARAAPVNNDS